MRIFFAVLSLSALTPVSWAETSPYFEPQSANDVYELFEANDYTVEHQSDSLVWLLSPNGTRMQISVFTHQTGSLAGIRLSGWYRVGSSQAAVQAAHYYERTNPMTSVGVTSDRGEFFISVNRDISFGPGRTPANLLALAEFQTSLFPLFQEYLAQSDPAVASIFSGETAAATEGDF